MEPKEQIKKELRERVNFLKKVRKNQIDIAYSLLDDVEQYLFDMDIERAKIYTSAAMLVLEYKNKRDITAGEILLFVGLLNN